MMKSYERIHPPHLIYPGTETLINKFGFTDAEKLNSTERYITTLKQSKYLENPLYNSFDLKHFQKIHKFLFEEVYSWAGELRDYNITKGNTYFCTAKNIHQYAETQIFNPLKKENFLKDLPFDEFIKRMDY